MSLQHEINKCIPSFADAVKAVMKKNVMDRNGVVRGTQRMWGYVCNVHTDEEDELYGTVDVQEYEYEAPEGFHEGVYVSALQNNTNGYMTMPSLYSDVIIAGDPATQVEYIVMASHVDVVQLRSHQKSMIGVIETEEFKEGLDDDESNDLPNLAETGYSATSSYDKNTIIHSVKTPKGEVFVKQVTDGIAIEAKDSAINIGADGAISIKGKNITVKGSDTSVESNNITLKGNIKHNNGGQKMVLGDKLIAHLQQLCNALSTLTVTCTSPGSPSSPPLNAASFASVSSMLQSDLSAKSKLD